MSDILIKGMEMPKSCYACMFFAQTNYWNKEDEADILSYCKRTGEKTWESVNGYLPNCPLVPVPSHGRLGDLDELYASLKKWLIQNRHSMTEATRVWIRGVLEGIAAAPTIIEAIEAEEGE